MDDPKQQIIDSLKQASNILVTVRNSPDIDQLAACIALTLILNNQGKHGTAVFSGEVPSVLEFLEPNKTLERNTDSLQDFIISLDKSKADKLRYKVEDSVVRIFITPYKTSITDKDLEFGQGDFNVDVIVALGVHSQDDLDQAITSHGRILHDATVISMNTEPGGSDDLGSINWIDTDSSSLSEMIAGIADSLAKEDREDKEDSAGKDDRDNKYGGHNKSLRNTVIDNQIATALLTGIVAETERFGNGKTTPATMETAAKLLTAGANQELVATKLSEPQKPRNEVPANEPSQYEAVSSPDLLAPALPPASEGLPISEKTKDAKASNVSIYEERHDDDNDDDSGSGNITDTPDNVGPIESTDSGDLDIVHPDDQPVEDQPANNEDHDLALSSRPLDHTNNNNPELDHEGPRSQAVSSEEIGLVESNPESSSDEAAGEKIALDLINNHKVQPALKRTVIQPLHGNHEIIAAASQEDAEAAEDIDVTPVAYGNLAPMLTHSQPEFPTAPAAPEASATIAPVKPEVLITPAFDMNAPIPPAAPQIPGMPTAPAYVAAPERLIGMPPAPSLAPTFAPPTPPPLIPPAAI